jgi:hypothetical protein
MVKKKIKIPVLFKMVVTYCIICFGNFELDTSYRGPGQKKTRIAKCCSGPLCQTCYYNYCDHTCIYCSLPLNAVQVRKSSFDSDLQVGGPHFSCWYDFCKALEPYQRSIDMMPFFKRVLEAYPNSIMWHEMHTDAFKALYATCMQKMMKIFLFSRFQAGKPLVFIRMRIMKISEEKPKNRKALIDCYKIMQSPAIKPGQFSKRKQIIKALFGLMTKNVMRVALEPRYDIDTIVNDVNQKVVCSILRRCLSRI